MARARGFKVDDLTVTAQEDTGVTTVESNPPVVNFSFTILTSTEDDEPPIGEDTGERGRDDTIDEGDGGETTGVGGY